MPIAFHKIDWLTTFEFDAQARPGHCGEGGRDCQSQGGDEMVLSFEQQKHQKIVAPSKNIRLNFVWKYKVPI